MYLLTIKAMYLVCQNQVNQFNLVLSVSLMPFQWCLQGNNLKKNR